MLMGMERIGLSDLEAKNRLLAFEQGCQQQLTNGLKRCSLSRLGLSYLEIHRLSHLEGDPRYFNVVTRSIVVVE